MTPFPGCRADGQHVSLQPSSLHCWGKAPWRGCAQPCCSGVGGWGMEWWGGNTTLLAIDRAKRMALGSPFSGAVACRDRQEGSELGCLCPLHSKPQTQPLVAECTRPPGQMRRDKSCWPWQVGQSPEALLTPTKVLSDS